MRIGIAPLFDQHLRMIRVFDVAAPIVAPDMPGNELLGVIHAHAIRIGFHGRIDAHILHGYRIVIRIERHPKLLGHARRLDPGDIINGTVAWQQVCLLLLEQVVRPLSGFAVDAHIGDSCRATVERPD